MHVHSLNCFSQDRCHILKFHFNFSRCFAVHLFLYLSFFHLVHAEEIILKLKDHIHLPSSATKQVHLNVPSLQELVASYDLTASERIFPTHADRSESPLKNIVRLRISQRDQLTRAVADLRADAHVEWVEMNYSFRIHYQPNDSLYSRQWYLSPLQIPEAWDLEQGRSSVIVGVIDTGIDYWHPELQGQLWMNDQEDLNGNGRLDNEDLNGIDDDGNGYIDDVIGWDFTDAPQYPDDGDYLDPDNDPYDEYPGGHGTPVAGIITAVMNNRLGIAGIAPGVKVMNLRAGTAGGYLEEDDVAEAIVYGVDNGCRIINMSFGDVVYSHLLREAILYGVNKGILFVASAGNSGNQMLNYPAAYDQTIAVGATDPAGNLASFSNFGSKIDLVAPGFNILSLSTFMEYGEFSGTSFSAPIVSGILALLWSHQESASAIQIKSLLLNSCTDLGAPGWDIYYGNGLANAYTALTNTQYNLAQIEYPETGQGVHQSEVVITGSATGSNFKEYQIKVGTGNNPIHWYSISQSSQQVMHDTLAVWNTSSFPDSLYTIELTLWNWDLRTQVHRVVIDLDRSPPELLTMQIKPMIIEDYGGFFIELTSDDQTLASLHYREVGAIRFDHSLSSPYSRNSHSFLLSHQHSRDEIEFYIDLENNSGLKSTWDNEGRYYQLDLRPTLTFASNWRLLTEIPGSGFFLSTSADCNCDGILDIFGNVRWPDQPESRLSALNFRDGQLVASISEISGFARDLYDVDQDGLIDLLAGYGPTSFLFSGAHLPDFSAQPIVSPQPDFWGARLYDLDNDGHCEVIALHQNNWHIFRLENNSLFTVSHVQTLSNPTPGDNQYGVPQVEIADMNQNGKPELILGDYDGDLILFESSASGEYVPVTSLRLEGVDATHGFAVGDVNGDGNLEIVIATQKRAAYPGESFIPEQYWILNILKLSDSGILTSIWQHYFYPLFNQRNVFSGLSVKDYDSDGKDEIFFTPYPRAYYIRFENHQFEVSWYATDVNSNAVPVLGERKILLPAVSALKVWELETSHNRPPAPQFFKISAADSQVVELEWSEVDGADSYLLTREDLSNPSLRIFNCSENYFPDTSIEKNHEYDYWVQAVDSSYAQPLSIKSKSVRIKAESPPAFRGVKVISIFQLSVEFSKPLGPASFLGERFFLLPDSLMALNAFRGKGSQQIIVGFQDPIRPGSHQLRVGGLVNQYGVPFLKDTLTIPFEIASVQEAPYVQKVEMLSKSELLITFNHPMDPVSVENPANYIIEPDDDVIEARVDEQNDRLVHVMLTGKNRMGSLGENYYLTVANLRNIWGKPLSADWNHRFLILRMVENLDNVVVFPNPLTAEVAERKITFGNLPRQCQIYVYDINGHLVIGLKNEQMSGGIEWDLRSGSGSQVANGVYLYVAKYQNQTKMGKFIIVR